MKKVSILALHLGYGGVEKSVVALANLLSLKYEVEIACTYKLYDKPVFSLNDSVSVKYLTDVKPNRDMLKKCYKEHKFIKLFKEGLYSIKVLRLRKSTMINYIKNCDSSAIVATRDIFDEWLSEYGSKDVIKIGWEHNHYHGNFKYANTIINANKNNDYLVLVSSELKKYYAKELKNYNCKCVYIPNVIEKVPEKCATLSSKRLISVGRLDAVKGYDDLLKIFSLIHKKHSDWCLDIIGDGAEKENLQNYIDTHHLNEYVKLHGFRDKDYINNLLNKSSIYLMTSHTESFGIVLIEAMSHGVPCIAFDSAEGAKEIIDSGSNGYLIRNRNNSAFLKKVNDLIDSKETRKKLGKEARKSIYKYTSDFVKEDWYKIIEKK